VLFPRFPVVYWALLPAHFVQAVELYHSVACKLTHICGLWITICVRLTTKIVILISYYHSLISSILEWCTNILWVRWFHMERDSRGLEYQIYRPGVLGRSAPPRLVRLQLFRRHCARFMGFVISYIINLIAYFWLPWVFYTIGFHYTICAAEGVEVVSRPFWATKCNPVRNDFGASNTFR
jgi:hypothetical protein